MKKISYTKFAIISLAISIGLLATCSEEEKRPIWLEDIRSVEDAIVIEKWHEMSYLEFDYIKSEEYVWELTLKYKEPHYYLDMFYKDGTKFTIETTYESYNHPYMEVGSKFIPESHAIRRVY